MSNLNRTRDRITPRFVSVENVESDAEAESENSNQGEDIPVHEENFPDNNDEAESFLQPMWSTPELLDHTAETSGLPMEGVPLAWRGNNTGKSLIVGYACEGFVTGRLIPAARRPIPSRAPNISEQSLARRNGDVRTERDIKAWGMVAWRVDKMSISQDPISLLIPMTGAWYPETYVYIFWWRGDESWESRHNLRYVCASNHLKTDMLIYNVAKEQEANYREALTGVRPDYPPATTQMINNHWKNVNAYRGAHWIQPRAEKNRRITGIEFEPVVKEEDNSPEFDNEIASRQGSIVGSNSDAFEEAGEEYDEGYHDGSNEGDDFEVEEVVRRYLTPIDEEGESRDFFTPEVTPSRARGRGEAQQRYGISTPRATRSPSFGHLFQGNRGQARQMPETPRNRHIPRSSQGNSNRSNHPNRGDEQRTPQSSRPHRFNQDNQRLRTPQSTQGNRSNQGDQQRQTPQSTQGNRSNQGNQRLRTPQSTQGNRSNQGDQQRQTPQSTQGNRSNQGDQQRQTPQSTQGNRSNQGDQQRHTPQSTQGNRSSQGNQQRHTPQSTQGNRSGQGDQQRQTPQSSRSNRPNQENQRQQTPQSTQGNRSGQGDQQRQTPQSSRSNRPNQENQRQQTPQSTQGNRSGQGDQQRQTPQSSRSNRSNQGDQQRQTPQSTQGNRSGQGDQQRQTPQSSRSNRSNQGDQQRQTPQSTQGNRSGQGDQQRQTPQSSRSNRPNQENQQRQTPQSTQGNRSNQGNQRLRTPQSTQGNRSNQGDQQRQTPQSIRSNRQRTSQGSEGDQRSAGLDIALAEDNQSQHQQRRGPGRPRRDLRNPPSNLPTRRSTRITRVPTGP
ncbi:uncharacterized protein N7529_000978 [Penicillium soppii]|uniref:uncharacterized protein n=1 Tax=Penicillium soppii TaxID=69789 RepID=UPI002548217B|nr:uncharacterized protein N7529_000978 [Penicillium soppii]KAJ5882306.1 hypothetical protein N7529_000978 [Penicillium soppii]